MCVCVSVSLQVCSTHSPQAASSCRACTCHVPHRHRKQGHKMGLMRTVWMTFKWPRQLRFPQHSRVPFELAQVTTAYFALVTTSYYFIILQSNIFEPNQKGKEKSDRFKQSLAAISFWALMQGGRPTATGHVSQCCRRAGQLGSANQTPSEYTTYAKSKWQETRANRRQLGRPVKQAFD